MKSTSIQLVQALKDKGFIAYWAGGCVRDMLLGKHPKDYDIVTNATPEQIEEIFEKTYPVGKEFGVILVHENGHNFEIATFRSDSGYSDGRRPDFVTFTEPKEDALRRDFTINALFYDPIQDEILDFVSGVEDLDEHMIKFVGNPEERILEDQLRLLRAVRFKNTLQFQWHPDTYNEIKKHADKAGNVSMERSSDELNKMMMSNYPVEAFRELYELGMLVDIMPELEATKGVAQPYQYHHEGDVFEHTMRTLEACAKRTAPYLDLEFLKDMEGGAPEPSVFHSRWAALFHDIAKPQTFKIGIDNPKDALEDQHERIRFDHHAETSHEIAGRVMKRLKFSNRDMEHILWVTEHHMNLNSILDMPEGTRNKWFRNPYFIDLMEIFYADIAGTDPSDFTVFDELNRIYHKWLLARPEEFPKLLTGEEIMELAGLAAGPELGILIESLEHEIHAHNIKTKEEAVEFIKNNNK
ncbi:MAG: HD domain-containing protein [Candidatus Peregrinibacteria bacterium]|nr:HD domain-containing protein [Candidatus Peregrinibacteria bacterium]MDZ4244586.1 HD domain-containing protein [Candidatus Gracilibacteria bacterium]